jgi:hypothetical protein
MAEKMLWRAAFIAECERLAVSDSEPVSNAFRVLAGGRGAAGG